MRKLLQILAIWVITLLTTPAVASPFLEAKGDATYLHGWAEYCSTGVESCNANPKEPLAISLTARTMKILETVNAKVNATIRQVAEPEGQDVWRIPSDGQGDCEDLQLMKRKLLVKAGLPRRALLMTVVVTSWGEGHALLMVRTTAGDFVLDNNTDQILRWDETKHYYMKRESQFGTGWVALNTSASTPQQ